MQNGMIIPVTLNRPNFCAKCHSDCHAWIMRKKKTYIFKEHFTSQQTKLHKQLFIWYFSDSLLSFTRNIWLAKSNFMMGQLWPAGLTLGRVTCFSLHTSSRSHNSVKSKQTNIIHTAGICGTCTLQRSICLSATYNIYLKGNPTNSSH